MWGRDVAIELGSNRSRILAITIANVEIYHLMPLIAFIVADIRNEFAIRRDVRFVVWPFAMDDLLLRAVSERNFEHFTVEWFVVVVGRAIHRHDQRFAFRRP